MTQAEINAETVRIIRERFVLPASTSDADALALADTTIEGACIRLGVAAADMFAPLWDAMRELADLFEPRRPT